MKKLLFLLLASFLVLAACGQEESKSEDKKETKSSDKEIKKDDKKKDDDKESDKEKEKSDDKSNEEVANEEQQSQEQQSTEQPVQSQEQVNTQEQQSVQSQEQPTQQEPTDQEKAEANAKVAKEHGYTGLPNGDAMFDMPGSADGYYSNDQLDPGTGLPKDDAVPHKNGEGPMAESEQEESDWVKGQDEWMNASESERTEIRKADAEKYGYEYDPSDYE